ncbi:putative alkaline shock family protein YloU [Murinocardiopsis flavida]|uniref:Putative alkaline shock family protein YloU n=1 Tax=Murinocardiopsis flavida TaxID=645275 RepID=A0A2P8D4Y9_9ACTN|nr:Asp23/Gls24 family envelope stress response protein [Murinocardiopsis flavida]PSK92259.1 putative alkaline shock family protein YloU [Murinocardiopsis flavida]
MTDTSTNTSAKEARVPEARDTGSSSGGQGGKSRDLVTSSGRTSIADHVVAKVAGMAAREVGGVYEMGGGAARAFGAVRDRMPGGGGTTSTVARGVSVEVGERQTAVDIQLVVEYGVSIPDLAGAVRRNVITGIERMTGLEVTEVNISVDDIHLPDDDSGDDESAEPRVQ